MWFIFIWNFTELSELALVAISGNDIRCDLSMGANRGRSSNGLRDLSNDGDPGTEEETGQEWKRIRRWHGKWGQQKAEWKQKP